MVNRERSGIYEILWISHEDNLKMVDDSGNPDRTGQFNCPLSLLNSKNYENYLEPTQD
jgi:hypothetical protein